MLTGEQLRAARALLRIEQADLAKRASVSAETIRRFEATNGPVKGREETIRTIRNLMEEQGAIFLEPDSDGGVGVRLAQDTRAIEWNETVERILETVFQSIKNELEERELNSEQMAEAVEAAFGSAGQELFRAVRDPRIPDMFGVAEAWTPVAADGERKRPRRLTEAEFEQLRKSEVD